MLTTSGDTAENTYMHDDTIFVLIHSPLVGKLTWEPVAHQMQEQGLKVIVPILSDEPSSNLPFWRQHAESAAQALAHLPKSQHLTLVAHSGAGPLLPAIGQLLDRPVDANVFVDAGVPRDGASRLDLLKAEDPEWAEQFHQELENGHSFPTWSANDLREVIPDDTLRGRMVAEIRPRSLAFFTESIPVFDGWPDAPCAYLWFSAPYEKDAVRALQTGWTVRQVKAGHFHMLVDPLAVAHMIVEVAQEVKQ